jgi:hypothetical protein
MLRITLVLFCEDLGHETFARALITRLALDAGVPAPRLHVAVARGGHGKVLAELELWQRGVRAGVAPASADGVVVMIDGNGLGWQEQLRAVDRCVDRALFPDVAIGCPEPHVEAWCAADLGALQRLTGAELPPLPKKSGRGTYKLWLREALEAGGVQVLNDPMDIAVDLVPDLDLYRASKASPSLAHLVDDVRAMLLRHRSGGEGG